MFNKLILSFLTLLLYCSSAVSQFSNDTLWEKPLDIDNITGIMYSPDNKYLAVVGYDDSNSPTFYPQFLEPFTGVLLKELNTPLNRGSLFGAFSHDSKYFAFSGYYNIDNTLRIWDVEKNELFKNVEMQNGEHSGSSFWAAGVFTPDGNYFWAKMVNEDGKVDNNDKLVVFDTETWKIVKSFEGIQGSTVKISKDGRYIGVADPGINLLVFDAQSMELYKVFSTEYDITDFAFSPDGKYIAATSENTIYLWSLETGELVKEIKDDYVYRFHTILFTADSNYLIIGVETNGDGAKTIIYDLNLNEITNIYDLPASHGLDYTSDSKYLALAHYTGIVVYDAKWGETGIIDDNPVEEVIYPNPSNGMVNINLSIKKSEKLSVSIYNEAGILIENIFESIAEPGLIIQWDCSKQPAGMYLCRVEGTNINKTIKIIKK